MHSLKQAAGQLLEKIETMQAGKMGGYSDNEHAYICKGCKDQGFIIYKRNKETGEQLLFSEYVAKFNAKAITDLKNWLDVTKECPCQIKARHERQQSRILGQSRLSPKFARRTFDNYIFVDPLDFQEKYQEHAQTLRDYQQAAFDMVRAYTNNYDQHQKKGQGFGLFGDPGTSKTHLLAAKTLVLLEKGVNSVFINTSEVFDEIRKCFSTDDAGAINQVKPSQIIDIIKNADDLSLDDIGTERATPFVIECFYNIINYRYEWEKPTSFSTNLSAEELKVHLTPKTYRRIIEPAAGRCKIIKGMSYEQLLSFVKPGKKSKYE